MLVRAPQRRQGFDPPPGVSEFGPTVYIVHGWGILGAPPKRQLAAQIFRSFKRDSAVSAREAPQPRPLLCGYAPRVPLISRLPQGPARHEGRRTAAPTPLAPENSAPECRLATRPDLHLCGIWSAT